MGIAMLDIDTDKVAQIIRHVAATEVMPRFNNLQHGDIREKNPGDFVTVADEASEKAFTQLLGDLLPGSLVVGEEAVSKDLSVLDKLKDSKPVWVIDPIDGTYNFAHGRSKFGILIALVQNGKTLYGWAYDAPGYRMAVGARGAGAFLNGQRLQKLCTATELKHLRGRGGGAQALHFEKVTPLFKELVNYRCSLHDFMDFITNDADFVVHLSKVTPWDHAAVNLLADEAGGYVRLDATGVLYDPTRFSPAFMIAAPDKTWWQKLHDVLYLELRK